MEHAYKACLLDSAMDVLGEAADYAVNTMHMSGDEFFKALVDSSLLEEGSSVYQELHQGSLSGVKLVERLLKEQGRTDSIPVYQPDLENYKPYWCGSRLAYLQWYFNQPYQKILAVSGYKNLEKLYEDYHTQDESRLASHFEQIHAFG